MSILLDPHLIVERENLTPADRNAHWYRVVALAANRTLTLGHESFHWILGQLQSTGFPAKQVNFGPPGFNRDCQKAVDSLLTRVARGSEMPSEHDPVPEYLGNSDARLSLILDSTEHRNSCSALMSTEAHWTAPSHEVTIGPAVMELLSDPSAEPASAAKARVHEALSRYRLHIVGGSPTASALRSIVEELGIPAERVDWTASEKAKPPRGMDKKWGALSADRDITLCVTGRVSHAVWEQSEKASESCGVKMLECATQGMIVNTVRTWLLPVRPSI